MKTFINCYLAIPLPTQFHEEFVLLNKKLKGLLPDLKSSSEKSAHITMFYLGTQSEDKIEMISRELKYLLQGYEPVDIEIHGFDYFTHKRPRTLYLRAMPTNYLIKLNKIMSNELGKFNFQEKSFKPHITISRIKDPDTSELFREHLHDVEKIANNTKWSFPCEYLELRGKEQTIDGIQKLVFNKFRL